MSDILFYVDIASCFRSCALCIAFVVKIACPTPVRLAVGFLKRDTARAATAIYRCLESGDRCFLPLIALAKNVDVATISVGDQRGSLGWRAPKQQDLTRQELPEQAKCLPQRACRGYRDSQAIKRNFVHNSIHLHSVLWDRGVTEIPGAAGE